MIKIVAHYLPQFYDLPENEALRGRGATDWTAVKEARPLFAGHEQPRRPLGGKYYRLDDGEVLRWQVPLALAHGLYGFCFRHYWCDGRPLWEKPAEWLLADSSLKLHFCFAWGRVPWARPDGREQRVSREPQAGTEPDWQAHFSYVAPFFRDPRYIKIDRKPVFIIDDSRRIPEAGRLLESWNACAAKEGFPGICFIQMLSRGPLDHRSLPFDAKLYFEPGYTIGHDMPPPPGNRIDYDDIYRALLGRTPGKGGREIPGVFTDWDDSPRRGGDSIVCAGSTPAKFEAYLLEQIKRCASRFDSDLLFINGWNAWADGAHLEPDERCGSGYLEAVKGAKERCFGLDLPLFYRTLF